MKKLLCLILVLPLLLSCLTACHFTTKTSGVIAGDPQSQPQVDKMLQALAENRLSDAAALMHPLAAEKADAGIRQLNDYLAGREVSSLELRSINVHNTSGTSGKTTQEQATYLVTLSDGVSIHITAVYLINDEGTGFISFQLILGVV